MLSIRTSTLSQYLMVLSCVLTTACSGGGGGGPTVPPATSTAPPITTSSSPTSCSGCLAIVPVNLGSSTGIAVGPIPSPVSASFGSAPSQIAVSGGATFAGDSPIYPANVTFPMISTSMKPASAGLSAVASPDATLTVLNSSGNYWNLQIAIPSLNVNANLISNENIIYNLDGFTYGYSYVVVGEWDLRTINPTGPVQLSTAFASGYETPTSGMPTTGSANFSGLADGIVFKPGSSAILETVVQGRANLSVNFSSGQLTGTLTQMRAWDGSSSSGSSWNDVSLNANIAPGTNRFNGTTAATSVPGSSSSLAGSATGSINGAFYGPAAQNVGAVWSLSDGSKSAIGALAATQ